MEDRRPGSFWLLAIFFTVFVVFLYGPTLTILVLSFQGPEGGLTFPLQGFSTHWYETLWRGSGVIDIWASFRRSAKLGLVVMVLTTLISLSAGYAFRRRFPGQSVLFHLTVASLIVPSIVVSLGIALEFRLVDDTVKALAESYQVEWLADYATAMGLFTSGLGAHLTWTLPFGLLIMFAVFNRFPAQLEEAARDLGASPWQVFRHVVLPLIGPSLVGVALFGFTLSWDEIARSSQAIGDTNTLPLELQGLTSTVTTPEIYALGTLTTGVSVLVIGLSFAAIALWRGCGRRVVPPACVVRVARATCRKSSVRHVALACCLQSKFTPPGGSAFRRSAAGGERWRWQDWAASEAIWIAGWSRFSRRSGTRGGGSGRRYTCAACWARVSARACSRWRRAWGCRAMTSCSTSSPARLGTTRRCGGCWPSRPTG